MRKRIQKSKIFAGKETLEFSKGIIVANEIFCLKCLNQGHVNCNKVMADNMYEDN